MAKKRMTHRETLNLIRHLYAIFMAGEGRVDGDIAHVADALRLRGVNILRLMGQDAETVIHKAENEWLRHHLRDARHVIDGQSQRVYHFDGSGWLNMRVRLWLSTRNPDQPDADVRRRQVSAEINGIIAQIPPMAKGLKAKKKGWEKTRANVLAGAEYEQPQLFADEHNQDAA